MSIRTVKIVQKMVIWASATVLLFLLINSNSPFYIVSFLPYLNVDLSFLLAPFTILFIFLLVSNISPILVKQSPWKYAAPKALYGLAISAFILMLFRWAPFPEIVTKIVVPLELIVMVFTGSSVAIDLLKNRKSYEPLLVALRAGIVAYAVYDIARVFSKVYEPIVNTVRPITVGLLWVSVGTLCGLFRNTDGRIVSKISGWISKGPIRNFTLGFFLTIYVNFVRPFVQDFPLTVLGEWIMIAIVVAVILHAAKGSSEKLHTYSQFPEWKKHTTQAKRQTGRDFKHWVSVQEKFVNRGIKESLLVYLTLALRDVGETEERILITLTPLVQYRDRKPSFWNFPWTKGKLEKENMEARRKLLESLFREIEKGG